MKKFNMPVMTVVNLVNENIITASQCPPHYCVGFECPDCISCSGGFVCLSLQCSEEKYHTS